VDSVVGTPDPNSDTRKSLAGPIVEDRGTSVTVDPAACEETGPG
jgi:hypothetical protein